MVEGKQNGAMRLLWGCVANLVMVIKLENVTAAAIAH